MVRFLRGRNRDGNTPGGVRPPLSVRVWVRGSLGVRSLGPAPLRGNSPRVRLLRALSSASDGSSSAGGLRAASMG